MIQLSKMKCEACKADANLLTASKINALLPQVEGWGVVEDLGIKKLKCEFSFKSYTECLSFANLVAEKADLFDHHPQIILEYSLVTVVWWSHKIRGLHKNDFIMASKTSELFSSI